MTMYSYCFFFGNFEILKIHCGRCKQVIKHNYAPANFRYKYLDNCTLDKYVDKYTLGLLTFLILENT